LARAGVDTAPILEREAARRGGLGFIGKSTMSIVPGVGGYFFLGELLLDVPLPPTAVSSEGCGRCRSCLDACPTRAFTDAYQLDARRCIAYLTIEHRGVIPRELRSAIGQRVFGCDICQDVCPYNAAADKHPVAPELSPDARRATISLVEVLEISAADYRRLVRGSALGRATRRMLQRNAAIALGNTDTAASVPPLLRNLAAHPSELVRGHVAWGLGRLAKHDPERIRAALETAAASDPVACVREEALSALASLTELGYQ
jgi:epoxyqueuosine reductase